MFCKVFLIEDSWGTFGGKGRGREYILEPFITFQEFGLLYNLSGIPAGLVVKDDKNCHFKKIDNSQIIKEFGT